MRKSKWIEAVEWVLFAVVVLFFAGVLVKRGEMIASDTGTLAAPRMSVGEP